jgi:hypothetical protein
MDEPFDLNEFLLLPEDHEEGELASDNEDFEEGEIIEVPNQLPEENAQQEAGMVVAEVCFIALSYLF